jgi:transketolase
MTQPKMVDVFTDDLDTAIASNPAGYVVARLADDDPRIYTLSADMSATLADFRERHPDRYVEMGIAETNSISVAAGLATTGLVPYIYSMGPFGAIKCAEQLRTDVAYNHLPVRFVARLSGLAMGFFGTSHHAVEDVAIMRTLANVTVTAPADANAVVGIMRATAGHPGPVYYRISENTLPVYGSPPDFPYGRWVQLRDGDDVTIIGHGLGTGLAVKAAEALAERGVRAEVFDAVYLKPFDEEAILGAARRTGRIVTVEDHLQVGGLGALVAETLGRNGLAAKLRTLALPDEDLDVGVPAVLYDHYGLTVDGLVRQVAELTEA